MVGRGGRDLGLYWGLVFVLGVVFLLWKVVIRGMWFVVILGGCEYVYGVFVLGFVVVFRGFYD